MTVRVIIAIAMGGAAGALARGGTINGLEGQLSMALLMINVVGSFLLGMLVVRLAESPTAMAAVGTGFCGGLTSMSGFAVDVAHRLQDGQAASALGLVALTVACTFAGALAGLRFGEFT